ncbi:hypothetical protein F4604DRAFT_1937849 [Suillus subluteus]|nr:hypothetical protein F4604DRAFT_1937849 [Suillus subluteus]
MSTPFTFSFTSHEELFEEKQEWNRHWSALMADLTQCLSAAKAKGLMLALSPEEADKGEKCASQYTHFAEQLRAVKEEATKQAELAAAKQAVVAAAKQAKGKGKGKGKVVEPEDDPMGEKDAEGEDEVQVSKEKEVLVMHPKARMSMTSKVARNNPKCEWCDHIQIACLSKPDHACDPCRKSKVCCEFSTSRTGPVKNVKLVQKTSSAAESAPAGRAVKPIADLIRRTASDQVQVEAVDVLDAEDEAPMPKNPIRAQPIPIA